MQSALAQPQASFGGQFLHEGLFEIAAAYLYHLVQNHPFIYGNKRIGAACCIVFLEMNGVTLRADQDGLVNLTLATAQGQADKPAIAQWLRATAEPA